MEKSSGLSASAIFYKKQKFTCISHESIKLDEKRSLIFGKFQVKDKGNYFVFGETQLESLNTKVGEDTRMKSVKTLIEKFKTQFADIPVIIAGDFNDVPKSKVIDTMESNFTNLNHYFYD